MHETQGGTTLYACNPTAGELYIALPDEEKQIQCSPEGAMVGVQVHLCLPYNVGGGGGKKGEPESLDSNKREGAEGLLARRGRFGGGLREQQLGVGSSGQRL